MCCVTRQIYEQLRSCDYVSSAEEMAMMCGKSASYLRSIWAKQKPASTDALVNLYVDLSHLLYEADNDPVVREMKNMVWSSIYTRANDNLGGQHADQ